MDTSSGLFWLETWNTQLSTGLGAFASFCGLFALFASGASCKIAGLLQIFTGLAMIAIEGPLFLPQLAMLAPAGAFFDGKPPYMKVAVYAVLTIVPAFTGCFKSFLLGFIVLAIATAVHGILLFARRPPRDEMDFEGTTGVVVHTNEQSAYSPPSP